MRRVLTILILLTSRTAPAHPQLTALNLTGQSIPLASPTTPATVLFFIASDCPISNRLLPDMLHLQQQYASQNVRFWFVYPNATETPTTIRAHAAAYGINPASALPDPHQRLAHFANARTTPEAAILDPRLHPVYTGRIDDRYLAIGKERPQPTHHDLADALAATLAGRQTHPPGGPTVGCSIVTAP